MLCQTSALAKSTNRIRCKQVRMLPQDSCSSATRDQRLLVRIVPLPTRSAGHEVVLIGKVCTIIRDDAAIGRGLLDSLGATQGALRSSAHDPSRWNDRTVALWSWSRRSETLMYSRMSSIRTCMTTTVRSGKR